jgi:hypothetical protein
MWQLNEETGGTDVPMAWQPPVDKPMMAWQPRVDKGAVEVEDDVDEPETSPYSIIATPAPYEPSPLQLPNALPVALSVARVVLIFTATLFVAATSAMLLLPSSIGGAPANPAADTFLRRRCIDETACWTIKGSMADKPPHATPTPIRNHPFGAPKVAAVGALRAWRSSLFSPTEEKAGCKCHCIDPMICWSKPEEQERVDASNEYFGGSCHGWDASITCWSGWPLTVQEAISGHELVI